MRGVQLTHIGAPTVLIDVEGRSPAWRLIILTTHDQDGYVFQALHAGASGFLLKDVDPDELRDAVRVVAQRDALLHPASPGG